MAATFLIWQVRRVYAPLSDAELSTRGLDVPRPPPTRPFHANSTVGDVAEGSCFGGLFWAALRSGMGDCGDVDQQRVRVEMLLAMPLQARADSNQARSSVYTHGALDPMPHLSPCQPRAGPSKRRAAPRPRDQRQLRVADVPALGAPLPALPLQLHLGSMHTPCSWVRRRGTVYSIRLICCSLTV